MDDLLASIGYGKTSVHQVLGKLAPAEVLEAERTPEAKAPKPSRSGKTDGGVKIRGVEDLLVRFAKCCSPVHGDPIVGFITRGRGLTVHTRECLTVVREILDKERMVSVEWDAGAPAPRPVKIAVHIGRDRPGLLAEISAGISSRQGNITKAEVTVTEDRKGINHFVVEVADHDQLQAILQAIREVRDVINVERVRGV